MKTPDTQFSEQDFDSARAAYSRVALSAAAKSRMRAELSAYADLHQPIARPVVSPFSAFSFFSRARVMYTGAFAVLLLATGTGISAAAEKSLPGDALYAVKVQVTEPVQVALIPTLAGKAQFHSVLAERRLDEAQQLIAKGTLTPAAEVAIADNFSAQVASVDQTAAQVATGGDAPAAVALHSDLEARIEARETLLTLALAGPVPPINATTTSAEPAPSEGRNLLFVLAQSRKDVREAKLALLERTGGATAAQSGAQVALATGVAQTLDAQGAAQVPAVAARIETARTAARAATEALGTNDQTVAGQASADAVRNVEVASILMTHRKLLATLSARTAASTTASTTATTTPIIEKAGEASSTAQ